MEQLLEPSKDVLDVLVQGLIVIIPIVISWFIRTYVRSSAAETQIASIIRLSNAAIDYVENLDRRGDLALPPDVKKGGYKLKIASQWAESELKRTGITISNEEASKWISAEFQKRVGDLRPVNLIAEVTVKAVDLIQGLEQRQQLAPPPGIDQISYLAELAADWAVAQLSKGGVAVSRDEARTWIRAELLQRFQTQVGGSPIGDRLAQLATQAVEFLEQVRAKGQILVQPGVAAEDVETDLATAWLLTEAAKQGLAVSSAQVAQAAVEALRHRRVTSHAVVVARS